MPLGPAFPIVGAAGIAGGTPFTLDGVLFVSNVSPATAASSAVMGVSPANDAVFIAAALTDPQPAATEVLRVKGGFISEAAGAGNADTFVAGRAIGLPANSTNAIVIVPHAASLGANAVTGSVIIGDSITWAGAAGPGISSVVIGKSVNTAQAGVQIAPSSTIGNGGGGQSTIVGANNTLTASQAASDSSIFGHGNTVDGAQGQGQHLVLGPNNTIHATATLGGNVLLVGHGNFASDGTNNNVMMGWANGFSVSGKGVRNILIGRNNQANGGAGPFSGNIMIGWGTKMDALPQATGVIAFADSQSGIGYSVVCFGNGGAAGTTFTNAAPNPLLFRLTDASGANVAGSNLTFRSSLGTGTGVAGQIIFQTGIRQAAGSTQHVATNRVLIQGDGTNPVFVVNAPDSNTAIPVVTINGGANNHGINFVGFTNGAGALGGTLTNSPVAGNPTFWMPVEVAGVVKFMPLW